MKISFSLILVIFQFYLTVYCEKKKITKFECAGLAKFLRNVSCKSVPIPSGGYSLSIALDIGEPINQVKVSKNLRNI